MLVATLQHPRLSKQWSPTFPAVVRETDRSPLIVTGGVILCVCVCVSGIVILILTQPPSKRDGTFRVTVAHSYTMLTNEF